MIVKYNHAGIINIGHTGGTILLMPGVNTPKKEEWDKVKTNPIVKQMIEDGKIEVVEAEKADSEEKEVSTSLALLHVKTAEKLVKETLNRDILKTWLSTEKRPSVLKALNEQLDKVTVKTTKQAEVSVG